MTDTTPAPDTTSAPTVPDYLHDVVTGLGEIFEDVRALRNVAENRPARPATAEVAARIRMILRTVDAMGRGFTAAEGRDTAAVRALRESFEALADELDPRDEDRDYI
ncbi:hypothetical protein ACFROC_18040 [Nocardia tengchongensis]|uniref:hypothetical protein n=1 Tax=Nocardia tengchongensis TaxID=2055889 RepID=UPI0036A0DC40